MCTQNNPYYDSVRLACQPIRQQCFSLIPNQHQSLVSSTFLSQQISTSPRQIRLVASPGKKLYDEQHIKQNIVVRPWTTRSLQKLDISTVSEHQARRPDAQLLHPDRIKLFNTFMFQTVNVVRRKRPLNFTFASLRISPSI